MIKSTTFDLDATRLIMDSGDGSSPYGTFQLGPSGGPGSATGTSNAGAYIDGTGVFNFVGDSDNYIRFSATGLEIETDMTRSEMENILEPDYKILKIKEV